MNQVIQLDAILSQTQNDAIQVYSANSIVQVIDTFDYAIDSVNLYGTPELFVQIHPSSTDSSLAFGTAQLNQIIFMTFFMPHSPASAIEAAASPEMNLPTQITLTDEAAAMIVQPTMLTTFDKIRLFLRPIKSISLPKISKTLLWTCLLYPIELILGYTTNGGSQLSKLCIDNYVFKSILKPESEFEAKL